MKSAIVVIVVAVAVVVLFFLLRSGGLDAEEVPIEDLSPTHASIALWMAGDHDAALSLLIDGDAGGVETVRSIPTLAMSESEYMNQSERAIQEASTLNIEASQSARNLARALMEEAQVALKAGRSARANQILDVVENMADELAQPGGTSFWIQQGDTIKSHILNEDADR